MTSKIPSDAKKALEFSATSSLRLANTGAQKFSQVCFNAFREHRRIVATFQDTKDAAFRMNVRNLADDLRQLSEIFDLEAKRAKRICPMRVEPPADKNKPGSNPGREF